MTVICLEIKQKQLELAFIAHLNNWKVKNTMKKWTYTHLESLYSNCFILSKQQCNGWTSWSSLLFPINFLRILKASTPVLMWWKTLKFVCNKIHNKGQVLVSCLKGLGINILHSLSHVLLTLNIFNFQNCCLTYSQLKTKWDLLLCGETSIKTIWLLKYWKYIKFIGQLTFPHFLWYQCKIFIC